MVVQVTPPGIANLGYQFWIIWAVICFSFIPITYLFYPETANRTLEDIDRFFETKPGIIVAWNKSMVFLSSLISVVLLYTNINVLAATQLHRPEEYILRDNEIAEGQSSPGSISGKDTEKAIPVREVE